ncbi:hypothetical protein ACFYO1_25845 [Nocardia sp. NPDC006044]|uniref:hypothetical protein n=1 Tax=Nocardia sp. NPDC006044 TaxID=3364306 RepID=UPI003696C428
MAPVWLDIYELCQFSHFRRELTERKITAMLTFLITMAVIVTFAAAVAHYSAPAGSSNVTDRDMQRLQADLSAMHGRTTNI